MFSQSVVSAFISHCYSYYISMCHLTLGSSICKSCSVRAISGAYGMCRRRSVLNVKLGAPPIGKTLKLIHQISYCCCLGVKVATYSFWVGLDIRMNIFVNTAFLFLLEHIWKGMEKDPGLNWENNKNVTQTFLMPGLNFTWIYLIVLKSQLWILHTD